MMTSRLVLYWWRSSVGFGCRTASVIGYNALDIGRTITPKLTSVDSPRYAIGEKSAELLIAALKGERAEQQVVDMGYRFTVGESV